MRVKELQQMLEDAVRMRQLHEKRLRVAALGYCVGDCDVADLILAAVDYHAQVDHYREVEQYLLAQGVHVPKPVRDGAAGFPVDPADEVTEPCTVRRLTVLQ